ncbi:MAG: hypothetical protein ACOY3Z_11885 [Thermodesulfobacteriota bacterium]
MQKRIAALLASSLLFAAPAFSQSMVCWQLDHTLVGASPYVYRLSYQDLGNGNYALVGLSETTLITYPPVTTRRVATGGAVALSADAFEVSLRTAELGSSSSIEAGGASLAASDIQLSLDATLNGTFRIVNTSLFSNASSTVNSIEGTVTLIDCNTP